MLWKLARDKNAQGRLGTIKKIEEVFNMGLLEREELEIPLEIKDLAEKREQARASKDWNLADKLRAEISKRGYSVEDSKDGWKIKKI